MPTIGTINKTIAQLKKMQDKLTKVKQRIAKNSFLKCSHCEKTSKIRSWKLIFEMTNHAHGQDFADWRDSDLCDSKISCPRCFATDYIRNHPKKSWIMQLFEDDDIFVEDTFATIKEYYN